MENKLVKIESTELDKVVTGSGLAIQEGEEIKQSYIPFIVQLAEIQEQSKKIDFENPQSIDESIARELRLKTVKIRTGASDLKDDRKRIFLLKGNLEQAAYKLIEASCKLTEETLVNVEKAREIAEKKLKEERKIKRIEILTALEYDFTFVDILNMPDESFDKLVLQVENERDAKIQAAIQIEKERLEKLEAERIENERIRIENEKLQAEIKEKERLAEIEKQKAAKELEIERKRQAEILAKQKAESERLAKIEAEKQAKIQAELKAQADAERKIQVEKELKLQAEIKVENELRQKLEREIQAKKDAEIKAQKEKAEAEKKAALAPDKDKLVNWIASMTLVSIPENLKNEQSKVVHNLIETKYQAFKDWALKQIETL